MEKVREKNKYIIYNEEGKILVFISKFITETLKFIDPNCVKSGKLDAYYDEFAEQIKMLLIDEKDICFLNTSVENKKVYTSEKN